MNKNNQTSGWKENEISTTNIRKNISVFPVCNEVILSPLTFMMDFTMNFMCLP